MQPIRSEEKSAEQSSDSLATLRQRVAELEKILEISLEITSATDLHTLLHKIVIVATELIDSEAAGLLLLDDQTGELRFLATYGDPSGTLQDIPIPVEGSIAGAVLVSGEPALIPDVRKDHRFFGGADQRTGFSTRSVLAVPLRLKEQSIGALEAVNKSGQDTFTQQDVKTLTALAAQAAVAIDNARLFSALRESHEQLEARVRRRTLELQLRNEELNAYSHTVTHGLKTPLATITGYAEVLKDGFDALSEEELRQHLHTIARVGRKMNHIIDEILLLSGLRQMEVDMVPLDMGNIVSAALQRLAFMIETQQAKISLPDTWPVALGHGPWIEEVWSNYVSNALKYGGQPPRVRLGATEQADGTVRFWVQDNGPGIPPEEQVSLFSPFTRLDQLRATGQGLGLSIARRIVEKLGGQVHVESQIGQGCTFSFTLPGQHPPDQT